MQDVELSRRQVLTALSIGTAGIAGCSFGSSSDSPSGTEPEQTATSTSQGVESPLSIDAPGEYLRDESVSIRVTGAEPGSEVTVRATMEDGEGIEWSSEMLVEANGQGVVDLSKQAPKDANYDGVDPMGWCWSMQPDGSDGEFRTGWDSAEKTVRITAETDTTETVHQLQRRMQAEGVTESSITSDSKGFLYEPAGDGPYPGVLVLHGSGGMPLRNWARLLASHGYVTLALQWYGTDDITPTETYSGVPLEYFDTAATVLRQRDNVVDGPVGVWGTSKGGEAALLLGARFDWVGAVVALAPSSLVMVGENFKTSTWSVDGEPVPYIPAPDRATETATSDESGVVIRKFYEAAVDQASEEAIRDATIAVEQTDAPLLLVSGRDDQLWQSSALSERAIPRLEDSDVSFPYEHLAFENAGHAIGPPHKPTTQSMKYGNWVYGGTPAGNAEANAKHWSTGLDYLERGLKTEG